MKSVKVFLNAFIAVLAALFCMSVQAQQASLSPFAGIERAQQICGPKITPDDLRGKIVFVEYWGTRCGPCRQSMPHLQEIYAQLSETGMFCIIGNHVQQYSLDTDRFLKEKGITFPVYQYLDLPVNKNFSGIPHAFLFDVTGRVVAEGHPIEIVNRIPPLIQEALAMKESGALPGFEPVPIPGGLRHPFADSDLGQFQKSALTMFIPGKPWLTNYKKLQSAAQSNDNIEARTALAILDNYLNDEILRLIELAKTNPAQAFVSIERLCSSIKGMSQGRALEDVFNALSADKNVRDLSVILMNIAEFESKADQMKPEAVKESAQRSFISLKHFCCDRKDLSKQVKKEAYAVARALKDKYGCSGKSEN